MKRSVASHRRDAPLWHAMSGEEVVERVGGHPRGLSDEEAAARLERHGPNRLPTPYRTPGWRRFLRQFHNMVIYVLLAAAVVTAALAHWVDTGVIVAVVVINALIGHLQEGKAERALDAVRRMLSPMATVLRGGTRETIPAEGLVPGDVVALQPGDKVPADLRLLSVRELAVDESALTGESVPVRKTTDAVDAGAVLGDRQGMAFSGTLVTAGQGTGVVVATGQATEIGRISEMLAGVEELVTPLLAKVASFGRLISAVVVVAAVVLFVFGMAVRGEGPGAMFLVAVGMAVAAIPEGLPAIMTITLAIGVQAMARRNAIIRRLPAVDTLGSVTVICSDKTGTLTRNEMTVTGVATPGGDYEVEGAGYAPEGAFRVAGETVAPDERPDLGRLVEAASMCNDASLTRGDGEWRLQGDPTEGALASLAMKAGYDARAEEKRRPRTDEIPFASEHRFMATLHHDHAGRGVIYVKGAPEQIMAMCGGQGAPAEPEALDVERWRERAERFAAEGRRVLAIAARTTDASHTSLRFDDVGAGLTLLGLVGIVDPPRAEAVRAVAECQRAGIRVKMITGDHPATATAVGAQLAIGGGGAVLTGRELEGMDEAALVEAARHADVFARVSPEHKLRLVRALQADGHVAAMTGDGVNDAPALKRADVGVAMGRNGTEVAKEASDMVLTDDNFASIAHAVEEGRTVYDNLRKAILFILPTNGAEASVVAFAVLLGMAMPITPVQILWVNLVTAVTLALALAFERAEPDIMRRPPRRPDEPLLTGFFVWRIAFVSLLLFGATLGLFAWQRAGGAEVAAARTVAVDALVVFEIVYLFNARLLLPPSLSRAGLFGNRWALVAAAAVLTMQLLYTYLPLTRGLFDTVAIGAAEWGLIALLAAAIFGLVEIEKLVIRRSGMKG